MNSKSFLWLAAAVASVHCAGAWAAGGPMTNRDGLVVKLWETQGNACGPPALDKGMTSGHTPFDLRENVSKFKFKKTDKVVHKIKLNPNNGEDKAIEDLVFYTFKNGKPELAMGPCDDATSFNDFPFAIAFHDLEDHDHPGTFSPHALIFVPATVAVADPVYGKKQFYLLVQQILTEAQCNTITDQSLKDGCLAFRYLYDNQKTMETSDFIVEIAQRVQYFKAGIGLSTGPHPFHNGVIHGKSS